MQKPSLVKMLLPEKYVILFFSPNVVFASGIHMGEKIEYCPFIFPGNGD